MRVGEQVERGQGLFSTGNQREGAEMPRDEVKFRGFGLSISKLCTLSSHLLRIKIRMKCSQPPKYSILYISYPSPVFFFDILKFQTRSVLTFYI